MSLNRNSLKNVHQMMPNREVVTFTSLPDCVSVAVPGAMRGPTKAASESGFGGGQFSSNDISFTLPVAALGDITPKIQDTITDASGLVYSILATTRTLAGVFWRCQVSQQRS